MDAETPAALANHHGYFDACGPEFVRALDAAAISHATHPDQAQSRQGHVVVRVAPGGQKYAIMARDSTSIEGPVLLQRGPFLAGIRPARPAPE
jgi:hypothetical protein